MFPVRDVPETLTSPESVVRFLVTLLASSGDVSIDEVESIVAEVMHRESLGSTAIGRGVAVPHVLVTSVDRATIVAGRIHTPLSWDGSSQTIRVVYLIIGPDRAAILRCLQQVSVFLKERGAP
jgi:mannitol/fructose-specific phosphotransferase system IIA component (Ntr-type)